MKTAILFDLDGTVMDTLGDLHASVNHTMERFGLPVRTKEEVREFVGISARHLIQSCLPEKEADPRLDEIFEAYRAYYREHCLDHTCPFDGVLEVLEELGKKYVLGVVSNKPDEMTKKICQTFFPGMYALGQSAALPGKPAPDMLYAAMQALGAERCVFVGDGETDVLTAKNAGMPGIAVLWGFRDKEQLQAVGAQNFCTDVRALPEMIEALL